MTNEYDRWLVDGDPVFGVIPGGTHPDVPHDAPIYLFHGKKGKFGWVHLNKHEHFYKKHVQSPEEWVWMKCQSKGKIYLSDQGRSKLAIFMYLAPSALLIIEFQSKMQCFSVVSLHPRPQGYEGELLGYYSASRCSSRRPEFELEPFVDRTISTVIIEKTRKVIDKSSDQMEAPHVLLDLPAPANGTRPGRVTLTLRPKLDNK